MPNYATNPDCSELSSIVANIALTLGAAKKLTSLESVVAEMNKEVGSRQGTNLPTFSRHEVVTAINEATAGKARAVAEASQAVSRLKHEARREPELRAAIDKLKAHLDAGTLPEKGATPRQPSEPIKELQEIRDSFAKALKNSEPAKQQRITEQIDTLTKKLAENSFAPPVEKPAGTMSRQLAEAQFKLDKVRGEIRQKVADQRPKSAWYWAGEGLNIARASSSAFGFHAPLRSGWFLTMAHPIQAATQALPRAFEAIGNEQRAYEIHKQIENDPDTALAHHFKMYLSPSADAPLAQQEEQWMGHALSHIPISKQLKRGYGVYLNVMRLGTFKNLMETAAAIPGQPTEVEGRAIANLINQGSGRGTLPMLEGAPNAVAAINTIFFSARQMASRFALLSGQPFYQGTARTRMATALEYGRAAAGFATVLAIGKAMGGTIDGYGKMHFGTQTLDMSGGLASVARIMGKTANSTYQTVTGQVPDKKKFGESDLTDNWKTFIRGHLSPGAAGVVDVAVGRTFSGEPTTPITLLRDAMTPLSYREAYSVMKEHGLPTAIIMETLTAIGAGLSEYEQRAATPGKLRPLTRLTPLH